MKRLLIVVVFLYCLPTYGIVRYVDIAATGANNGSSWVNANTSLQAAIDLSAAGDSIFMAAGVYQPDARTSYRLKDGVKIFGGFPHGSNPTFTDRNWRSYQTILKGDGNIALLGRLYNLGLQTELDGVHITTSSNLTQGGVGYMMGTNMLFSNCRFYDNSNTPAQGGIFYMLNSSPRIRNCIFEQNRSVAQGGIFYLNDSSPIITGCIFNNNDSQAQGGIIFILFSSPEISHCVFSNNRNPTGGSTIFSFLGGTPKISNCQFLSNTTGSGLLGFSDGMPLLSNCVFANNSGQQVAILSASSGSGSKITLAGCLFFDNAGYSQGGGGMINNSGNTVEVINATFYNNKAATSGRGSLFSNTFAPSVTTFANSIIRGNTAATIVSSVNTGPPTFSYCIVQGMNDPANQVSDADPLFVNPSNAIGPDNIWATADDGLDLLTGSPAIDQGNNTVVPSTLTTDISSGARTVNNIVDMGAYEFLPSTTCQPTRSTTNAGVCRQGLPYVWNGQSYNAAGSYPLRLTNAAGCDSIATLILTVHEATSSTTNKTICPAELPFQWNGLTLTQAGSYNVTLKNVNGCDSVATLVLAVGNGSNCLSLRVATTPAGCKTNDGVVTATASGGKTPYQYSIDGVNFQVSNTFNGLAARLYTISLKDADGTLVTVTAEVTADLCLDLIATPASCNKADGVITATGSGGKAPYQYAIAGGNFQTSNVFANLAPQKYNVTIKDADGLTLLVPITVNTGMCLSFVSTPASCKKQDGVITLTGSGGQPPYQYSIDGIRFQTGNVFSGLAPNTYRVTMKDVNGTLLTGAITVAAGVCLDLTATPAGCDQTGGVITATGSGGIAPYQFSIDGIRFQTGNVFTGLPPQSYLITIKDGNGDTYTATIAVTATPCLTLQVAATTCGKDNGSITASGTGGKPPFLYSLNGSDYQTDHVFSGLAAGVYKVSAKDASGAIVEATAAVAASVAGRLSAGDNVTVAKQQPVQLKAVDVDNIGFNRFSWSPAYGLDRTDISNPVSTVDREVTYTVTATAANGCESTAQVTVKVLSNTDIYVPTAFTPNNDGKNDVLRPLPFGIREFRSFAIYNRWGRRVFFTTDPRNGWDGRVDGTLQNTSTFVWVAEGVAYDGSVISRKGSVTLIR